MFNLTSQERKTVIFVLSLLILGLGLDFLRKHNNSVNLSSMYSQDQLFDKVDINKATFSQLINIPNLGQNIAQRILDYRKSHGYFKDFEELKQVKGIKDKKLEQIKKYITIETQSQ